jgi:hypothetical protein
MMKWTASEMKDVKKDAVEQISEMLRGVRMWGERHYDVMKNADWEDRVVQRVYGSDKGPIQRGVTLRVWPLEEANREILRELDERLALMFRGMIGVGIKRPSIVSFVEYRRLLFSREIADSFDGHPERWLGANLVLQRLESTGRLATQYDKFEMFGDVVTKNGSGITFHSDRRILRPEMIRRGLILARRAKKDGNKSSKN